MASLASWHGNSDPGSDVVASAACLQICHGGLLLDFMLELGWRMRNTITVMNAKGGVGKSTLVFALAETLSTYHGKSILVIDADAQASISHLLTRQPQLEAAQSGARTIDDYLNCAVLQWSTPR